MTLRKGEYPGLLPPPRSDSFAPSARPRPYGSSKPPYMALKPLTMVPSTR